jgi:CBS domain containing-hemolysin-like protein
VSAFGVLLVLVGAYLAVALVVTAWRRSAEALDDTGIWIALFGLWVVVALPRWLPVTPVIASVIVAGWLGASLLLTRLGMLLARRSPARGLVWLLGPAHALTLAVSWIAAARLGRREDRQAQAQRAADAGPPAGDAADGHAVRAGAALESVVELGETTVEQVMVPRSEVRALDETASVRDWADLVRDSRHSHLPVCRGDLDEIRGYVCVRDIFQAAGPAEPVTRFLREARFVPASMRCDDLLRDLIAHAEKIAVVVDEFGGTAGIVRDRDLFEILLGEIEQAGAGAPQLRPQGARAYLADGQLRIDDFNARAAVALPEGDYETLAGLVLVRLGRIPAAGTRIQAGAIAIEVVEATERRIVTLRITLPPPSARTRPVAAFAATARAARGSKARDAGGDRRR